MNDSELLRQYWQDGSEQAFAELVERHVNLVFSAAARQVGGDRQLAQDVAQSVFCDLAKKARTLSNCKVLSGWLYTSARFAAAKLIRGQQRRFAREQEVYKMRDPDPGPSPEEALDWNQLEPALDDAMHELKEIDRNVVLFRFFEGRPFSEIGARLGLSEDAARMRVERALDKLRGALARRGVSTTGAALAVALAGQSVTAAPAGLAASISGAAIAGVSFATAAGPWAALPMITMTKLKTAVVAIVLAGMAVPLTIQYQSNEELNAANLALAGEYNALASQIGSLTAENARLSNLVAISGQSSDANIAELARLRAEVTRARQEARDTPRKSGGNDPIDPTLQKWGDRVARLRERLARTPELNIPELKNITEKAWLDAVAGVPNLETDEEYREALSLLRGRAKGEVGRNIQQAIKKFAEANGGMLPTNLADVQPFLENPVDPAVFARYELVANGRLEDLPRDTKIFRESAPPLDEEYETHFEFFINGTTSASFSVIGTAIEQAAEAFAQANDGLLPRTPEQVMPYLQRPIEPARIQRFLSKIPPNVTTLAEMQRRQ